MSTELKGTIVAGVALATLILTVLFFGPGKHYRKSWRTCNIVLL